MLDLTGYDDSGLIDYLYLDLPRINPSRTGRPYRIVWGTAN